MTAIVPIECPRCGGKGYRNWAPENGRCYRCGGSGEALIDVGRHFGALRHLRGRYVALRAHVRALRDGENGIPGLGETLSEAELELEKVVSDGKRVRRELELAGADPDN